MVAEMGDFGQRDIKGICSIFFSCQDPFGLINYFVSSISQFYLKNKCGCPASGFLHSLQFIYHNTPLTFGGDNVETVFRVYQ